MGAPEWQTLKCQVPELVGSRMPESARSISVSRLQFRVRFPREIWIVGDENLPNVSWRFIEREEHGVIVIMTQGGSRGHRAPFASCWRERNGWLSQPALPVFIGYRRFA